MPIPLPKRPNVRHCTHIKVTGQQCGSPALRGEFFCYFHTRVIKRRATARRYATPLHGLARRLRVHSTLHHARSRRPAERHARGNPRPANRPGTAHSCEKRQKRPLRRRPLPLERATHGPPGPRLRPPIPDRTSRTRPPHKPMCPKPVWRGHSLSARPRQTPPSSAKLQPSHPQRSRMDCTNPKPQNPPRSRERRRLRW